MSFDFSTKAAKIRAESMEVRMEPCISWPRRKPLGKIPQNAAPAWRPCGPDTLRAMQCLKARRAIELDARQGVRWDGAERTLLGLLPAGRGLAVASYTCSYGTVVSGAR